MTAATVTHESVHPEDLFRTQRLGVLLVIAADVAFVLSLMFTYFYLRGLNTNDGWIPKHYPATASIGFSWLIAGVMVLATLAFLWGQGGAMAGDNGRLVTGALGALALVLVDLGLQIYQLATLPFKTTTGGYSSAFIALALANVLHLLLTLFIGLAAWNRARVGRYSGDGHLQVRLVGYWYTWVAIAALLTAFTTSFVASPHGG